MKSTVVGKNLKREPLAIGLKLFAWARAIRWTGWGFGESLIPVFLFMFSATYLEAGAFRSIYELTMIATLPIAGMWADRISARKVALVAFLLYPLVGLSYFFAGLFGLAVCVLFARSLNGFLYAIEGVSMNTYYRRIAHHSRIGESFGYIDVVSNLAWIAAALIGASLVSVVPIHLLLLLTVPFSILAYFIARRVPPDYPTKKDAHKNPTSFIHAYKTTIKEWSRWSIHSWMLAFLILFLGLIEALMWFFVPISAYLSGIEPAFVVLIMVMGAIPALFNSLLGRIADNVNNYLLISMGLLAIAILMVLMYFFPSFVFKLVVSFIISTILNLFSLVQRKMVTILGSEHSYGAREGAFSVISTLGDVLAPLAIGIVMDAFGFGFVAIGVAVGACLFGLLYFQWRKKIQLDNI